MTLDLPPNRPLTLGPGAESSIAVPTLKKHVSLLVPGMHGYGLRLHRSVKGSVTVGGRTLRFDEGLIIDPRPEPLVLKNADRGTVVLGGDLSLRFTVHRHQPRRFASLPRMDTGLMVSLGIIFTVFLGLILYMSPWDAPQTRRGVQRRLVTRPAILQLARQRSRKTKKIVKKDLDTKAAGTAVKTTRRAPRRKQIPRRKKVRAQVMKRGLLGLLKRQPGGGSARARSPLAALDKMLTSMTGDALPRARATDKLLAQFPAPRASRTNVLPIAVPSPRSIPRKPRALHSRAPSSSVSREAIRKVVMRGSGPIRLCYEKELLGRSKHIMEGRILLRWKIDASGKAVSIEVIKDDIGSKGLRTCIIRRIDTWRFPPCSGTCKVIYPFDFYPQMS